MGGRKGWGTARDRSWCCFPCREGGGKRTQINDRPEVIGDPPRRLLQRLTRSLLSATRLTRPRWTSEIRAAGVEFSSKVDASPGARISLPRQEKPLAFASGAHDWSATGSKFSLIAVTKFPSYSFRSARRPKVCTISGYLPRRRRRQGNLRVSSFIFLALQTLN